MVITRREIILCSCGVCGKYQLNYHALPFSTLIELLPVLYGDNKTGHNDIMSLRVWFIAFPDLLMYSIEAERIDI